MDVNSRFRLKRFAHFVDLTKRIEAEPIRILDLGGEEAYWRDKVDLLDRPISVTLLNLTRTETLSRDFLSIKGDARSIPEFANNSFDVVHSNSVIEHVGTWRDMKAMAAEVRRLAPAYFVQTPYFWFPVEPHFRSLGFHWMPESMRIKRLMQKGSGFVQKCSTVDEAMIRVQGSALLDRKMFSALFPDARILFEKWMGLPKSMMAIRSA